ncbi:Type III restriction enzyme, res subunit [Candidatus Anstonella stagnisolia]|nr:Type III restriction enzyme, res subunit [Candidatus Anstonella stagnisolia]
MMTLRNYQEKYVDELKDKVNNLLKYDEDKTVVFEAPTGAGKTIMMAEFLKRLVLHRDDSKKFAFIWISVHQLHSQSKDKLARYFEHTRIMQCSDFEDLNDKQIGENEILFLNWESINKDGNIYIRDNEHDNNLSKVVENTKEDGREIILVIDESHYAADSEKSIRIVEEAINPKVTIEVSATPRIKNEDEKVKVHLEDVVAEGMIKREIAINPEIDKNKVGSESVDELVIKCALKRRRDLLDAYKKEGANINPLMLIQLPDRKTGVLDKKEEIVALLKNKFGITVQNRKLAIWLSDAEDKVNLENIEKPDNDVEVLLFKQAIALGWDCPRAAILVLFRDMKSFVFTIQTVGRIMRMPELKHYENEMLNKGYVFTNLPKVEIAQDIAKEYITVYESRRSSIYTNVDLPSIYLKRQRERTRLSGEFRRIFVNIAKRELIKPRINLKPKELVNQIIVDGVIKKLDKPQIVEHKGEISVNMKDTELQYYFDLYCRAACTPYAPTRSSEIIQNTLLYAFFRDVLKIGDETKAEIIALSEGNNQIITDYINEAKDEYKRRIVDELDEQKEIIASTWNVPVSQSYNSKYELKSYKKAILQPPYAKTQSKPEQEFIALLEDPKNNIKWWYKNGESESKFFGIKYTKDDLEHAFYPDFILMMKDGRIGIFDTKEGRTAEDAKPKAEVLTKYIKKENARRGKQELFGGIVVLQGGSCRYNDSENYEYDKTNLGSDWKFWTAK